MKPLYPGGFNVEFLQSAAFDKPRHFESVFAMIDHDDFSVVIKNKALLPKSWRWEIYRAGRASPVERSETLFETMAEANRAGKRALHLLLSEFPN